MKKICVLLSGVLCLTGAASADVSGIRVVSPDKVIYGRDDRREVFQVSDAKILHSAASTVMLMKKHDITLSLDGKTASLDGSRLMDAVGTCSNEPYAQQITPGFCSGSLIGPDLILTAGHCITDEDDCSNASIVFGFAVKKPTDKAVSVPASEVYACAKLVDRIQKGDGADYAILRLERKVTGHEPLKISDGTQIKKGTPIYVIGHPSGLPMKIAGGATVRDASLPEHLVANLDTYGGNSGSPVFNAETHEIEGVLVRGETDYTNSPSGCMLSNRCADGACRGEDVTRVTTFLPTLAALDARIEVNVAAAEADAPAGIAQLVFNVKNAGTRAMSAPAQLLVRPAVGRFSFAGTIPALAVGASAEVRVTMTGLDPFALAGTGVRASVTVKSGNFDLGGTAITVLDPMGPAHLRAAYRLAAQLEVKTVDVVRGKAMVSVTVSHQGTHPLPYGSIELKVGAVARQILPPVPGATVNTVLNIDGLASLDLVDENRGVSVTAQVAAGLLMEAVASQTIVSPTPARDRVRLAHELAMGRPTGAEPSALPALFARITDDGVNEARRLAATRANDYASGVVQQTVLGQLLALRREEIQPSSTLAEYHRQAGEAFYAERGLFRKILIFRSPERKAFEKLCKELSR